MSQSCIFHIIEVGEEDLPVESPHKQTICEEKRLYFIKKAWMIFVWGYISLCSPVFFNVKNRTTF